MAEGVDAGMRSHELCSKTLACTSRSMHALRIHLESKIVTFLMCSHVVFVRIARVVDLVRTLGKKKSCV